MVMTRANCLLFRRSRRSPNGQPTVERTVHLSKVRFRPDGRLCRLVRETSNAGHFEVQCGHLALERSQHVGVRGYATQTVKDADEMLNRVKFINEANVGASMSAGLNDAQRTILMRLVGLSGADIDREYMRSQ